MENHGTANIDEFPSYKLPQWISNGIFRASEDIINVDGFVGKFKVEPVQMLVSSW